MRIQMRCFTYFNSQTSTSRASLVAAFVTRNASAATLCCPAGQIVKYKLNKKKELWLFKIDKLEDGTRWE